MANPWQRGKNTNKPVPAHSYIPPEWKGPKCVSCGANVYSYELQEPPTCIWCEIQADESKEFSDDK